MEIICYNTTMDKSLKKFIKENYVKPKKSKKRWLGFFCLRKKVKTKGITTRECCYAKSSVDFQHTLQEPFVQHLFKLIDERDLKDSDVYKKANLDRKLFSKIRCSKNYLPSKNTILALAVGLELNIDETKLLLDKAGFSLSKSLLTDVIVEYYITKKEYDILIINNNY